MLPPQLSKLLENLKKAKHVDATCEEARKNLIAELDQVSKTLDTVSITEQQVYRSFGARSTNVWGNSPGKCVVCGK